MIKFSLNSHIMVAKTPVLHNTELINLFVNFALFTREIM